jgi:2-dehydro-3-deoxyphosphogluconate aldolase/(4S)-4-hydroxy-2-oxoglutarate aldolase
MKNFRNLVKFKQKYFPDLLLGMGTVTDEKIARKAIESGADFLVSPGYSKEIYKSVHDSRILWIPGCMTASEIMQVVEAGIHLVKIFPASIVGPSFIKAMKEIFSDLLFVPTGGINSDNIHDWLDAGACAVGMGSSLFKKSVLDEEQYDLLKSDILEMMKKLLKL